MTSPSNKPKFSMSGWQLVTLIISVLLIPAIVFLSRLNVGDVRSQLVDSRQDARIERLEQTVVSRRQIDDINTRLDEITDSIFKILQGDLLIKGVDYSRIVR